MRDPREVFGERIGFAFEGGGLRGGSQPGHCQALFEAEIFPEYLFGSSVGAMNAAPLSTAHRPSEFLSILKERIIPKWDEIDRIGAESVFPYSRASLKRLWDGNSLLPHDTLYRILEDFDYEKSVSSPIEFEFSALRLSDKSCHIFSNHDQIFRETPALLKDAVISAACVAPIFGQIQIAGDYFDDGGFAAVSRAVERECDTIFILYPWPENYRKPLPPKGFIARHVRELERLRSNHAAFLRTLAAKELKIIDLYNEIADRDIEIVGLRDKLSEFETREEELLEEISGLRLGQEERNFVNKILGAVHSLKDKVFSLIQVPAKEELAELSRITKKCRRAPLYSDPPDTLVLDDMCSGDIKIARERACEITRQELYKWLK